MARPFGTTPHSDIAHAFDAEKRQHTFVESLSYDELKTLPEGAPVFTKKYELRLSFPDLIANLDSLAETGKKDLTQRQLRIKILATLGLVEEG